MKAGLCVLASHMQTVKSLNWTTISVETVILAFCSLTVAIFRKLTPTIRESEGPRRFLNSKKSEQLLNSQLCPSSPDSQLTFQLMPSFLKICPQTTTTPLRTLARLSLLIPYQRTKQKQLKVFVSSGFVKLVSMHEVAGENSSSDESTTN